MTFSLKSSIIIWLVYRDRPCPVFLYTDDYSNRSKIFWEVRKVANIKSAKKRVLVAAKRADRNKAARSKVKTYIKKVEAAIASGDKEAAKAALIAATSVIDTATSKGIYHKNTSSRKVSRMAKAVNAMD